MAVKKTVVNTLVPVTFELPASVQAETIALCGDFNDWARETTLLERGTDGHWSTVVDLEPGQSYRYRYLIDGTHWENDWAAHSYVRNSHGSDDSVVVVPAIVEKSAAARSRRPAAARTQASTTSSVTTASLPPRELPMDAT